MSSRTLAAVVVVAVASGPNLALFADSARPGPSRGEAGAAAASQILRAQGLQLGYSLDHTEALDAFRKAIAASPNDPAAYRLAAATAWIELLFQQGAITVDDYLGEAQANVSRDAPKGDLAAAFHDFIDHAIVLSEERLRTHPADADAHYQAGAAYGCLASYIATVEGRLVGSLGPARRAYREHERALALDPGRTDAGLILGIYQYVVANLPAPIRLMARMAGIGGNRELALRLVEAAAHGTDSPPDALFTLILLYNREARFDDAMRVIGELKQRFPRNRLLWLEAGHTALRAGRPADAKTALEEGLARMSADPRPRAFGEDARWRYAYGAALVALKDRAGAEPPLRAALAGARRDWLRGRAHKELGKLADLGSDRARALDEYRAADRLCRQDKDDECRNEVRELLRTPYR